MGQQKHMMQEQQDVRDFVENFLLDNGYLNKCDSCDTITDDLNRDEAYKTASSMFKKSPEMFPKSIRSQKDLTDIIKDIYDQSDIDCICNTYSD